MIQVYVSMYNSRHTRFKALHMRATSLGSAESLLSTTMPSMKASIFSYMTCLPAACASCSLHAITTVYVYRYIAPAYIPVLVCTACYSTAMFPFTSKRTGIRCLEHFLHAVLTRRDVHCGTRSLAVTCVAYSMEDCIIPPMIPVPDPHPCAYDQTGTVDMGHGTLEWYRYASANQHSLSLRLPASTSYGYRTQASHTT